MSASGGAVTHHAVTRTMVQRGGARIEVLAQGTGQRIVLLPSLGRGASDFDLIAELLAAAGYRVLRPQPRGIGASESSAPYSDLHDCSADIAAVIESDGDGPALVAGHAFGNRVARMLATDRPDLVRGVCLIAANVGHAPSSPVIREAIRTSADPARSDAERLKALSLAFFARGNDPSPWLAGWYPDVLAAQRIAGDETSRLEDYAAGSAPILYLKPSGDPLVHADDAVEFQRALGERVIVVTIDNASHAAIAEQPDAVSRALAEFARTLWPR